MATRGYFRILNDEDPKDVYQKTGDILVEAHHDGYRDVMLQGLILIPFKLAKMQSDGYGKRWVSMTFFPESILPKEVAAKRNDYKPKNFPALLEENRALGYYDFMWSDILPLLQMTEFGQYADIQEGVTRYGYPVTFADSYFDVKLDSDGLGYRLDKVTISDFLTKKGDEDYDEEGNEYQLESITKLVEGLNAYINTPQLEIKADKDKIEFSITGIALDLMFHGIHKDWEEVLKRH